MASADMTSNLISAIEKSGIGLKKIDLSKTRPIYLESGVSLSVESFRKNICDRLGREGIKNAGVGTVLYDTESLFPELRAVAESIGILETPKEETPRQLPPGFDRLTLNFDLTHLTRDSAFFVTNEKEIVSYMTGAAYLKQLGLPDEEVMKFARPVVPEYLPRNPAGVSKKLHDSGDMMDVFNMYIPPQWTEVEKEMPDKLPPLFQRLVNHLLPLKEEREYFYDWLHDSLFTRANVYLVLQGAPAAGKNRLKLVMRALHGHSNTVDGKKSTFNERFNSQLQGATLAWFDELHYDQKMENVMKEVQNDTVSIERKGVDATRATEIHASFVISNNTPRDNHIDFAARKFAPLKVTEYRLDSVMSSEEIGELTDKVQDKNNLDKEFLAQIAQWLKRRGNSGKWPNLEYKGPHFWFLANTSLSNWQKVATQALVQESKHPKTQVITDEEGRFLWSDFERRVLKRLLEKGSKGYEYTNAREFFNKFYDSNGKKIFETLLVPESITNDFYIRVTTKKPKLVSISEIAEKEVEDEYADIEL